jgi:Flp pilus assembly protein TadD/thiol-disulfide isomerase/thioredoxin
MMLQGRSFSGHERNCCFLNTGSAEGRFANISALSGLDYDDDGRALSVVDWDHDGDLDVWISNRNAPQLRFLRNDNPAANRYVSLKLVGDGRTVNRDAIGARVEVTVAGQSTPFIKTVRAGEGFLAQSSKWLHFGLGQSEKILNVVVHWPADAKNRLREQFEGVKPNGRYLLTQGSGTALAVADRAPCQLAPSVPRLPEPSDVARVPAVTLLRMPNWSFTDESGSNVISIGNGKPVLINLWASWCAPCITELLEFQKREAEIVKAGIQIVALSVDGLDDQPAGLADASPIPALKQFPFLMVPATHAQVQALQDHHNLLVAYQRPLPLPSSFLIDAQGRLAVIYKGPVSVEQLLHDLHHSELEQQERWVISAPIEGRAIADPAVARTLDRYETILHYRRATRLRQDGQLDAAAYHFQEVLRRNPQHAMSHYDLAAIYMQQQRTAEARTHFQEASRLDPTLAKAHFDFAKALEARGEALKAIVHYQTVLVMEPGNLPAMNNLAWLLAVHPNDEIRDGAESFRLATQAVTLTAGKAPEILDTLAASQAELGKFDDAVNTAKRAIELAESKGAAELAEAIRQRLRLYLDAKPYRRPIARQD